MIFRITSRSGIILVVIVMFIVVFVNVGNIYKMISVIVKVKLELSLKLFYK